MNGFIPILLSIYSRLLRLYPRDFQNEFAEEMQVVLRDSLNEAAENGILPLILIYLRELGGLPIHVLREFWHELERKEAVMEVEERSVMETGSDVEKSRWDAFAGILPFLLAGIMLMFLKFNLSIQIGYPIIVYLAICLFGLWVGLMRGFPRWAFSYLGWSVVISYWWAGFARFTFSASYDPGEMPGLMGIRAWIPLLMVLGLGLLVGRSSQPLRKLTSAIWHDWTLLSLSIYTFAAFILLMYDENHHPYLLAFMAAGTFVVCLAVWSFLQSNSSWKRVISLVAGFVVALVLSNISYATWDYAAYYNLPPSIPQPWYQKLPGVILMTLFWVVFIFWPALVGLVRHTINDRKVT